MEKVKTENAVGMVLGHDITEIVPGEFKGIAFKKGHIIREEDIERFLRIGKENIYVFKLDQGHIHEDDAAIRLGNLFAGPGIYFTDPGEGKINIKPKDTGYLKINRDLLDDVNDFGEITLATIQGDRYIGKDELIAGCRIIPLTIDEKKIDKIEELVKGKDPIFEIIPFIEMKVGLIITGSEVYKGRIEDKFGPVIEKKVAQFGSDIFHKTIVADDIEGIKSAIFQAKEAGAEMIIVTGGMSVDPDDKTPGAIKATGADVVSYGTPILPGAMLMLAYLDDIPVFGLPGCVMFSKTTAFDLLLPRVFAGMKIIRRDITRMGYGGQCLSCKICTFPNCHFGKH